MRDRRHDNERDVAWDMVQADPHSPDRVPDDEDLVAYRAGTLDDADRERIELALATSDAARRRLAALSQATLLEPPTHIRDKLFGAEPSPSRLPQYGGIALAVAALLAAMLFLWPGLGEETVGSDDLRFNLRIEGLALDRSDQSSTLQAYPETQITLDLEPQVPRQGVGYAVYRMAGGVLRRLEEGRDYRLTAGSRAVRITATAQDLVGDTPGNHPLFVVAARDISSAPAEVTPGPDETGEAALDRSTGGLSRRSNLTMLSVPDAGASQETHR